MDSSLNFFLQDSSGYHPFVGFDVLFSGACTKNGGFRFNALNVNSPHLFTTKF